MSNIFTLVGRWLMNEKTSGVTASGANTVKDISAGVNDGTPNNSPVYRPGFDVPRRRVT